MARPSEPLIPGRGGRGGDDGSSGDDTRPPPSLAELHLAAKQGQPIPLVYGPALVAPRPIYSLGTGGQKVIAARTGDGGAAVREHVDAQTANVVLALGEAPFAQTPTSVIRGRDRIPGGLYTSLADLVAPAVGLQTAGSLEWTTAVDPAPWARLNAAAAGQTFRGVAQMRAHKLALLDGRLPDLRVPVRGLCWDAALAAANPADVLLDLLARAGVASSAVEVDLGLDGLAASSYRRYVSQAPWPVGRAITEQTSIRELVDQLLQATNASVTKSQGADGAAKLKVVPLGDRAVGTYAPPAQAATLDDDEIEYEKGRPPVVVEVVGDEDVFNAWPITIVTADGTASTYEWIYAAHAAERAARYGGDGVRRAKTTTVPWLVRPEDAIRLSMIWALRSVHVTRSFRVTLGPRWGLLEPGDVVQLRHSVLELDVQSRIRSIVMRERGRRELLLQEVPEGVATPVDLTPQAREGLTGTPVSSSVPELVGNRAKTYMQAGPPSSDALRVGDLWFDSDDNNHPRRWDGGAWVSAQDGSIAIVAAGKATTYVQASAPSGGLVAGDLWFDSDDGNKPHRWSGSAWVAVQDAAGPAALADAADLAAAVWAARTIPTGTYNATAAGGGVVVSVGASAAASSDDGGGYWTSRAIPAGTYHAVAWNGTRFCAVGASVCATSTDGETWTAQTIPAGTYRGIAWNGSVFCAVGDSAACATSPDGVTWTARTIPAGSYLCVAWGAGKFVAGGSFLWATSPTGTTWTSGGAGYGAQALAWNGSTFAAADTSGFLYTSPDGSTWTGRFNPHALIYAAAWSGSVFAAVGNGDTFTSRDGLTWKRRSMPSGTYRGVTWAGSNFVAVGTSICAASA